MEIDEKTLIENIKRIGDGDPDFLERLSREINNGGERSNRVTKKERKEAVEVNQRRIAPLIMLVYAPIIAVAFANGNVAGFVSLWGGLILWTQLYIVELATRDDVHELTETFHQLRKKKPKSKKVHKLEGVEK